jgi:hypothetical protein
MDTHFTLVCKLGRFVFDKTVPLHKAKFIRDECMGQYFNPKPQTPVLRTEDDIEEYARTALPLTYRDIPFEVCFA